MATGAAAQHTLMHAAGMHHHHGSWSRTAGQFTFLRANMSHVCCPCASLGNPMQECSNIFSLHEQPKDAKMWWMQMRQLLPCCCGVMQLRNAAIPCNPENLQVSPEHQQKARNCTTGLFLSFVHLEGGCSYIGTSLEQHAAGWLCVWLDQEGQHPPGSCSGSSVIIPCHAHQPPAASYL